MSTADEHGHHHEHDAHHDHEHGHTHSHGLVDASIVRSKEGVKAVSLSLLILFITGMFRNRSLRNLSDVRSQSGILPADRL